MPRSSISFSHLNCFECFISHLCPGTSPYRVRRFKCFSFSLWYPLPLFLSSFLHFIFFPHIWLCRSLHLFFSQVSWTLHSGPQWVSMDPSYLSRSAWTKLFWTGPTLLPVLGVSLLGNESESRSWKHSRAKGHNTQIKWAVNHFFLSLSLSLSFRANAGSGRLKDVSRSRHQNLSTGGYKDYNFAAELDLMEDSTTDVAAVSTNLTVSKSISQNDTQSFTWWKNGVIAVVADAEVAYTSKPKNWSRIFSFI